MPTRNEVLADYYIGAAGIAGITIDPDGRLGLQELVGMEPPAPGQIMFCCTRGRHILLVRLAGTHLPIADEPGVPVHDLSQEMMAHRIQGIAWREGSGLTPHADVRARALEAVNTVNAAVAHMQKNGGMKDFNAGFKAARKIDRTIRYFDYLHARKAAMLETLARGARL